MRTLAVSFFCVLFFIGCASKRSLAPSESLNDQLHMAQKVMGGMAGQDVSHEDMRRAVKDVQGNKGSREAVNKILGGGKPTVVKYSPLTGKHYSGDLEFDPETGVKLEILPE